MANLLLHSAGIDINEVKHQPFDVLAPLSQLWQGDGKHIQAVIKIAAEFIPTDQHPQIAMGGCNQADIDVMGSSASKPFELLFLQNPQQLWLQCQRKIPHFHPGKGCLCRPIRIDRFFARSPRECSLLMAKQLTL